MTKWYVRRIVSGGMLALALLAAQEVRASTLDLTDAGLTVWLRADSVTITTNPTVASWLDLSGGSGDGVFQNAALTDGSPSIINNAVNGRPAVNFGGGGGYTFSGTLGISGQAAFTIFAVAKDEAAGATNQRIFHMGAISAHSGGQSVAAEQEWPSFRYNDGNNLFASDKFTNNTYELGMWRMDTTDNYGSSQFARQGMLATRTGGTNPGNTISLLDQGYTLGKGISTTGGNSDILTAEVSEVLLYNRALNPADTDTVEFYLRHRYSLAFNAVDIPGTNMAAMSANVSAAPAPASIDVDVHESNVDTVLFIEKESFTLTAAVAVNIAAGAGTYTNGFDTIDDTLAADTVVNSYYLSFDTADNGGTAYAPTVTVEFDNPILGIVTSNPHLIASEGQLGAAGTTYNASNLGMENNATDTIVIAPDGRTLTATLRVAGSNLDQFRVLTAVPEPASMAMLAAGGLLLARRRRRTV